MKIKLYNEAIDLFFILSHKSNYKLLKPNKNKQSMLRKNNSEQCLTRQQARISLSKKLPSDFFLSSQSTKHFSLKRHFRLMPINDENKISHSTKPSQDFSLLQRKMSFQFTFYRSPSSQMKRELFNQKKEKSSKMDVLQKFNLKLPYLVKSAESGMQRRKKLVKVKRVSNLATQFIKDDTLTALR